MRSMGLSLSFIIKLSAKHKPIEVSSVHYPGYNLKLLRAFLQLVKSSGCNLEISQEI